MSSDGEAVIGQPIAVVLFVLILGASIFMRSRGGLRSRAAMLAIGGILAVLAYFAFLATPTIG